MAVSKTDYQIEVINRVKTLRMKNEMSQQQLADMLGITNGSVGNIESLHYSNKYTLRQLTTIARHFNVPVESFFMAIHEESITLPQCIDRICDYMESGKE